jgi:hypothetical protein
LIHNKLLLSHGIGEKGMWTNRMKVVIVSLFLSLLVLPLLSGVFEPLVRGEGDVTVFEEYWLLLLAFAMYATPVILCTAVPVNLIAGFVTKKVKHFKLLMSFLIHIIPAGLIGLMGGIGFTSLTLFVAFIFFGVDYLIIHRESSIKFRYVALVPFAIILFSILPEIMEIAEDSIDYTVIKNKKTPQIDLYVNQKRASIHPSSCWTNNKSEGCMVDTEPYILPISPVGIDEMVVSGDVEVEVIIANEEKHLPMDAYYIDGNEIVKTNVTKNTFTLPAHIKEQVVKVVITTESNQKLFFSFGIRNGNRDI